VQAQGIFPFFLQYLMCCHFKKKPERLAQDERLSIIVGDLHETLLIAL
jgi:hypothetical protein